MKLFRSSTVIILSAVITAFLIVGSYAFYQIYISRQAAERASTDTVVTTDQIETSKNARSNTEEKAVPKSVFPTPKRELPQTKVLNTDYHIFQTFNNCGPASLSMALRFFGLDVSQQTLGQALRPYQHPKGDNDDKSVTLEELALEAQKYGFNTYHRPAGDIEIIIQLIAIDLPVITRTWLKPNDDIGHYRLVKGYDESQQTLIQDDSLQGKNLSYTYEEFNLIWEKFNYEYLVLVPEEKTELVEDILGDNAVEHNAWQEAIRISTQALGRNPADVSARLNLSVALYNIGDYKGSVTEFENIENNLPQKALWYQIEPIYAYYELENYSRVFEITDRILDNGNRAFSELYLIRGNSYLNQGQRQAARSEFEKAVLYNRNMVEAKNALESL